MGVLHIENMDKAAVRRYHSATLEEKHALRQFLSYWFSGDEVGLEQLLRQRKQGKEELLKREALEYADRRPVFPLNWSQNKSSRDEMNER
ncbi:MAG: hypothetical protein ACTFAK_04745 [Candidatus Electronema sp. VV]